LIAIETRLVVGVLLFCLRSTTYVRDQALCIFSLVMYLLL